MQEFLKWRQTDSGALYASMQPAIHLTLTHDTYQEAAYFINQIQHVAPSMRIKELVDGAAGKLLPFTERVYDTIKSKPELFKRGARASAHILHMQHLDKSGSDLTNQFVWTRQFDVSAIDYFNLNAPSNVQLFEYLVKTTEVHHAVREYTHPTIV